MADEPKPLMGYPIKIDWDSADFNYNPEGFDAAGILKSIGPITISGTFHSHRCAICHSGFTPGPEGVPSLSHSALGTLYPACPACVIKFTT